MDGELWTQHYATGHPVRLQWRNGLISEVTPAGSATSAPETWLAPPLLDVQVNGFAGVDFQLDNLTEDDLLRAVRGLHTAGCSRFMLTLVTDEWGKLMRRLRHLRALRAASVPLQRAIAGWHLEGPFLSSEPGFSGAHDSGLMVDPTLEHVRELRKVTESDLVLLTLAPERAGALEAITLASSFGIKVSLGHTNASSEILRRAVEAGATGFTHFGNACPQQLDRHDNIFWRVMETPGLSVSVIPDGIHVSPSLFRIAHRLWNGAAIFYTTDAMAAAGAGPGKYALGRLEVEVGADQVVRQPGRSNFAGSALRPVDGVFRAAAMLGRPWQEVWDRLSSHPARFLGLAHGIMPGSPADFCIIRLLDSPQPAVIKTFVGGEEV